MAKDVKTYDSEFKKLGMFMYAILALLFIVIILLLLSVSGNKTKENDYDISTFKEVGVSEAVDLFNSTDTYVLYIGRETCDICHDLLPKLKEVQINHNYITQYLDISKADRNTDSWKKLMNLLDVETTTTMDTTDGTVGEEVTNTFGYFINAKGYTPCTIVISKGKQVAGFFGDKDKVALEDWLANYGI